MLAAEVSEEGPVGVVENLDARERLHHLDELLGVLLVRRER
jgi:hypothetical protein